MSENHKPNVNVTWASDESSTPRTFPCPVCAARLDLRRSRSNKPYCVCNSCGIQVFFRGKAGIGRLREFLAREQPTPVRSAAAAASVIAFSRLEHLRAQKADLEQKRPLIFTDKPLESAIAAVEHEIADLQHHLAALAQQSGSPGRSK